MIKLSGLVSHNPFKKRVNEADESDKYTHIGYGKYKEKGKEKDPDAQTFKKDDSGKFSPVGGDKGKTDKPEPKQTKIAADPFADDSEYDDWEPEAGLGYDDPDYDMKTDDEKDDEDDWEPEDDDWEESIIPRLKKEFKQYNFIKKYKNWKKII